MLDIFCLFLIIRYSDMLPVVFNKSVLQYIKNGGKNLNIKWSNGNEKFKCDLMALSDTWKESPEKESIGTTWCLPTGC